MKGICPSCHTEGSLEWKERTFHGEPRGSFITCLKCEKTWELPRFTRTLLGGPICKTCKTELIAVEKGSKDWICLGCGKEVSSKEVQ